MGEKTVTLTPELLSWLEGDDVEVETNEPVFYLSNQVAAQMAFFCRYNNATIPQ
jgi:hypothetical protein